ncbi:alpha-2,8-sialyltransferase 8F-like isoform X1 [Rana temporaria]|uniref:alpha-2,8-sialyltransferase 8F-like isoform X1 n=1 Tax=Rana temporaria TaxID=8407 RepID=UPI001AACB8BC|nr:alpha-2,8-sialyltransferase 8F-like isoform X1 [Rana temporaria]
MMREWMYLLSLSIALTCYLFYLSLQITHRTPHSRIKVNFSTCDCSCLKSVILSSVLGKFEEQNFFELVKAVQGCPWKENQTEHNLHQANLRKCCNASYSVIMTQENTAVGQLIRFDAEDKITQSIIESLYSLFPKKSPFQNPIRSCAVVGNGGILNNSSCGAEIDGADFVFRLNFPPLNWTNDVGTKTDLVTSNPSILLNRFNSLTERRKSFIMMVQEYGSPLILLPAFSYSGNTEVSLRVLYTIEDFNLNSKVVFFNPDFLRKLTAHWTSTGIKSVRLSSGLMAVSVAMEVCDKVTLYGFWPFSQDLDGVPILHHYFDNVPPVHGIHAMPDEFYQYLQMHVQGSLRLNLKHC